MNPKELTFNIGGITLAAQAWGEEHNPRILALHGWLDNAGSFEALAKLLTDRFYIVALDLPGHGLSDHTTRELYQFHEMVNEVQQVLDALFWQQCIIIGHSLGGAIACEIAAQFPKRVTRLACIDSLGILSEETLSDEQSLSRTVRAILKTQTKFPTPYQSLNEMAQRRAIMNGVTPEEIMPIVVRGTKREDDYFAWRFDDKLLNSTLFKFSEQEVYKSLAAIVCPILLLEGDTGLIANNTFVTNRKAKVKNLQEIAVTGGHHVHLSATAEIAALIRDFCNPET